MCPVWYVGVHMCAEVNFMELVLSFSLSWAPGIELGSPGLQSKRLYWLGHLSGSLSIHISNFLLITHSDRLHYDISYNYIMNFDHIQPYSLVPSHSC